jgi:hypothetical protein
LIRSFGAHARAQLNSLYPVPNFNMEFLAVLRPARFLPRAPRFQAASPREIAHMQVGQCGSQLGTEFSEVVCDDNGIGGGGEYCGDSNAQLGRVNVLYPEAPGGKYVPSALLMDLESGVIGAVALNR